jgi:branched-chain amino acid transport system permease protein
VLVVIILGGMRRLYGAFAGAVVFMAAQDLTAEADPFRWMFVIGAMLMAAVLFLDNGLIGALDRANAAMSTWFARRER